MINNLSRYFKQESHPYSLALYRIGFGILVMFSLARFALNGWIESLYLEPDFHFSYYGFSWVKPIGIYTYLIFFICFSGNFLLWAIIPVSNLQSISPIANKT